MPNSVGNVLLDYGRTIGQNSFAVPVSKASGLVSYAIAKAMGKEDPTSYGTLAEHESFQQYGYVPRTQETIDALERNADYRRNPVAVLGKLQEIVKQQILKQLPEQNRYGADALLETGLNVAGLYGGRGAKFFPKRGTFSNMADKMERFEISDASAKIKPEGMKYYKGRGEGFPEMWQGEQVKLSQILDHKPLFKQYPHLKDIEVDINIIPSMKESSHGSFNDNGILRVTDNSMEEAKSVALHEIQHAIQEREGFARGGNPTLSGISILRKQSFYQSLKEEAENIIKSGKANKPVYDQYERAVAKLKELDTDPMTYYLHQAGEIEARDAASRMNLTGQQRRRTSPYTSENIPINEWIVRGEGGKAMSVKAPWELKVKGDIHPDTKIHFQNEFSKHIENMPILNDFKGLDTTIKNGAMEFGPWDNTIQMRDSLAKFSPSDLERIFQNWDKDLMAVPGLNGTIAHEVGHVLHDSIRKRLPDDQKGQFFDGLKELQKKLGNPSKYSEKGIGEWLSERYSSEYHKMAEPVLTEYLKKWIPKKTK